MNRLNLHLCRTYIISSVIAGILLMLVAIPTAPAQGDEKSIEKKTKVHRLATTNRSPYDAFVYINRIPDAPEKGESANDLAGRIFGRLANQEGRVLVKLPSGMDRDAYLGFKTFFRYQSEGKTNIGNCAVCHTPPEFTDLQNHIVTKDGSPLPTPSLRNLRRRNVDIEKVLKDKIAASNQKRSGEANEIDDAYAKMNITNDDVPGLVKFLNQLNDVNDSEFRQIILGATLLDRRLREGEAPAEPVLREGEAPAEPVRQEPHPPGTFSSADRLGAKAVDPDSYRPTLEVDPPVPQPPEASVRDFNTFLQRLRMASERSVESLLLHGEGLDRAEQVFLSSDGVPDDVPIQRHRPFFTVNPEAIFGLYSDLPTMERGLALYQQSCSQCHGTYGRGNGSATSQWYVGNYPRNFTYARYKSRSTQYGTTPTDGDLYRTLTRGLYGSTMPSFRHLSVGDRWALVQFLKSLGNFYDDYDEVVGNRFDLEGDEAPAKLEMGGEPPVSVDSVTRGRDLFVKHACVTCHQGTKSKPVGLGRSEGTFSNWSDEMSRPIHHSRDLTTPIFLAGSAASDLFRIIAGGPNIGPMPNYESLSREESWDLVHYMQSLFKKDYPQVLSSSEVQAIPKE